MEDAAIGDFGVPLYGATLIGSILYPSSNRNGCSAFSESVHQDSTALPPILLVDRGGGHHLCCLSVENNVLCMTQRECTAEQR